MACNIQVMLRSPASDLVAHRMKMTGVHVAVDRGIAETAAQTS